VTGDDRQIRAAEPAAAPPLSLLFGWGAMAPLAACAGLALAGLPGLAAPLASLWGGAVLAFLAGIRRGVSFRQPGGPRARQILTMLVHFLFALAALGLLAVGLPGPAAGLLTPAYASLALTDRRGALAGTMPLHFARLRPAQAAVATVSLAVVALLA
jgi:hypothetical protein